MKSIPSFMSSHKKLLEPEEEYNLISEWITTKDTKLLQQIISAFSPIVIKYARKYSSYGIDADELISVGNLALVEVIHRFEPAQGNRFATFATGWIKGMMLGFIANNYISVAIKNQKIKKVFFTLRSILNKEFKQTGTEEITKEFMDMLIKLFGVSQDDIQRIHAALKVPNISLNEVVSEDGEQLTRGDMLLSKEISPEDNLINKDLADYRRRLLYSVLYDPNILTTRERTIVLGSLVSDEERESTLEELSQKLNISRERVRQIKKKAFTKIEQDSRLASHNQLWT